MKVTIKILFCAAVTVAFFVVYWTGLSVHKPSGYSKASSSSSTESPAHHGSTSNPSHETSPPPPAPHSDAAPESADQGEQMDQVSEYSRFYLERQRSLLASDGTNLNLEAVKHAGDWDQGFLQMQETFKASLDLASAPAVPDFQVPAVQMPFQVPAVQAPAFQAPAFQAPAFQAPAFQVPAFQVPAFQAPTFRAPAFQAPAFQVPAFQVPAVPTCCVAP